MENKLLKYKLFFTSKCDYPIVLQKDELSFEKRTTRNPLDSNHPPSKLQKVIKGKEKKKIGLK